MNNFKAENWVNNLGLMPHPEGGYFKEVYRSEEEIPARALPARFKGNRNFSTAIYYLLGKGDFSAFHRIHSDETWHFYAGDPLEIWMILPDGESVRKLVGISDESSVLMFTVTAGTWFAARSTGEYSLCGCTVAPGFDFADFEMGDYTQLTSLFPQHEKLIKQFTRV